MRIQASIRPPAHIVDHLEASLRGYGAQRHQVAWIASTLWRVRLAGFGNVVRSDAVRLTQRLAEHIEQLPSPTLRLSGVVPLPEAGDDSVWVGLEGDLDALDELASAIPGWVYEFGFMLDRRSYRPRIQLARVTDHTALEYLQGLVEQLGSYQGPPWTVEYLTLGGEKSGGPDDEPEFDVFDLAYFSPTT